MPSWRDLMEKTEKTETEQVLIQCIATLSSHPNYRRMTPDEIYDAQVRFAQDILY